MEYFGTCRFLLENLKVMFPFLPVTLCLNVAGVGATVYANTAFFKNGFLIKSGSIHFIISQIVTEIVG